MKITKNSPFKWLVASLSLSALLTLFALAHEGQKDADDAKTNPPQTLKGEVVDLMCYLDHGAKGEKHDGCARTCIESGGPVGLLVDDKVYLIVGAHKPMNDKLAPLAAKTVTLKGKVVERDGMRLIENAEIVKD